MLGELLDRHRIACHVVTCQFVDGALGVKTNSTRFYFGEVIGRRFWIHQYCDFRALPPGDVTIRAAADVVPGRHALYVGGKEVLPAAGNAHLEERAQQYQIGGLAARPVAAGYQNRKVVNYRAGMFRFAGAAIGWDIGNGHVFSAVERGPRCSRTYESRVGEASRTRSNSVCSTSARRAERMSPLMMPATICAW